MESNKQRIENNLFYHLPKKDAIWVTKLIQRLVDEKVVEALNEIKEKMPTCDQSEDAANAHYTRDYEDLSYSAQQEYEGIMHGWQDCVVKVNEVFDEKLKKYNDIIS